MACKEFQPQKKPGISYCAVDFDMPRQRVTPDRAALEIAHSSLKTKMTVDEMLSDHAHAVVLKTLARKHIRRRERIDIKKLQANDND